MTLQKGGKERISLALPAMKIVIGVSAYGLVVAFCVLAALGAHRIARSRTQAWHWLACAAWFVGLMAIRFYDVEDRGRTALRELARQEDLYADRWMWQAPLTVVVAIAMCGLMVVAFTSYPGTRVKYRLAIWISQMAVLAYIPLYALRLISLHAVDRLLYSAGPVPLNWVIDGGLALAVLLAAAFYLIDLRSVIRAQRDRQRARVRSDGSS